MKRYRMHSQNVVTIEVVASAMRRRLYALKRNVRTKSQRALSWQQFFNLLSMGTFQTIAMTGAFACSLRRPRWRIEVGIKPSAHDRPSRSAVIAATVSSRCSSSDACRRARSSSLNHAGAQSKMLATNSMPYTAIKRE